MNKNFFYNVFVILLTIFLILGGLYVAFAVRGPLIALLVAFIIALAVAKPIRKIHKKTHWSLFACGFIVYALIVLVLGLFIWLILPTLVNELYELTIRLELLRLIPQLDSFVFSLENLSLLLNQVTHLGDLLGHWFNVAFQSLVYVLATFFLSFYLSLGKNRLAKTVKKLTGNELFYERTKETIMQLEVNLGGWIRVRIILFFFVSLLTFLMLSILGVPYALSLGILAGLLDVIMLIGPIFAAIPGVLLALNYNGLGNAIIVTIFYVVIQNVESLFVAPRLFHQHANVSPVIGILGVIAGWYMLGLGGAFLAIPLIIIVQTLLFLFRKWHQEDLEQNPT